MHGRDIPPRCWGGVSGNLRRYQGGQLFLCLGEWRQTKSVTPLVPGTDGSQGVGTGAIHSQHHNLE